MHALALSCHLGYGYGTHTHTHTSNSSLGTSVERQFSTSPDPSSLRGGNSPKLASGVPPVLEGQQVWTVGSCEEARGTVVLGPALLWASGPPFSSRKPYHWLRLCGKGLGVFLTSPNPVRGEVTAKDPLCKWRGGVRLQALKSRFLHSLAAKLPLKAWILSSANWNNNIYH